MEHERLSDLIDKIARSDLIAHAEPGNEGKVMARAVFGWLDRQIQDPAVGEVVAQKLHDEGCHCTDPKHLSDGDFDLDGQNAMGYFIEEIRRREEPTSSVDDQRNST